MSRIRDNVSILHVDDDIDIAETTATFLKREDDRFVVETAASASEGLSYLAEKEFDCIVSDYDMPGQDGIEFLTAVRESHSDLPFILYTGKGSEKIASKAISAGVTDYLQKETGTGQYAVLANRIMNAVKKYRAQRELETSQKRLSLFIEQSPLGVLEYDSEANIVRVNDAAEEILGYSESELRGETWEKLVSAESYQDVDDVASDLLAGEGGYHSIDENVRKDGERIICEWYNRVVTDEEGATVAVFSLFQDITDRKEREQQLEQSTARLEALFENSPDMIDIHTVDGTIVDMNQQFCEALDRSKEKLTGQKVWDIDQELDPESVRETWHSMDVGDQIRAQTEFKRADGESFPAEVRVARLPIDDGDRFMAISRDISERKRQEQQLNEFASMVSHDLRNPLSVAAGGIELARQECDSKHLDRVADAHARMERLIEDLLTLAREGTAVSRQDAVDLGPLLTQCWSNVATGDATLEIETDHTIRADAGQLQQLAENLLRNAVEHGGTGVTVTVGGLDDGFYIEDDGQGIPAGDRADVFDHGYSTTTDGTGFGLSIVKQVADAHGWDVRVTEGANDGARFEFSGVEIN